MRKPQYPEFTNSQYQPYRLRFYVVACNNPAISGTVNISIVNDGISIGPNNNGSFGRLRINATSLGGAVLLPVSLINFQAVASKERNELSWTVSNSTLCKSFDIETSTDGSTFKKAGSINAIESKGLYSFTDALPSDLTYYRLKIMDKTGNYSYSSIVNVSNNISVQISPNPASNDIVIKRSKKGDDVDIIGANGAVKLKQVLQMNGQQIDLKGLPSGNYFIKIISKGNVIVRPLIIIK